MLLGAASTCSTRTPTSSSSTSEIAKFRANLKSLGVPFHVEKDAVPTDASWNADGHVVVPVTRDEIAALVQRGRRFLVF